MVRSRNDHDAYSPLKWSDEERLRDIVEQIPAFHEVIDLLSNFEDCSATLLRIGSRHRHTMRGYVQRCISEVQTRYGDLIPASYLSADEQTDALKAFFTAFRALYLGALTDARSEYPSWGLLTWEDTFWGRILPGNVQGERFPAVDFIRVRTPYSRLLTAIIEDVLHAATPSLMATSS
jgi:hypothetical protein